MSKSKASMYIILCEDKLQWDFVYSFLTRFNSVDKRQISLPRYPGGKGCGERKVREKYADQVKACRDRLMRKRAKTALIVVIDADVDTVENRRQQLKTALEHENLPPRSDNEIIVHLIPKRHIDTWLAVLANHSGVNENDDYKTQYGFRRKESDAHPLFNRFAELFRNHQEPENCLPSLHEALQELERLRDVLKSS